MPALFAAGCSGASKRPPTAAPGTPASTPFTVLPETPTPTPAPVRSGGIARLLSRRSFTFDTFDADLTGDTSTVEVLGRTHSRLLNYADFNTGQFQPDLASRWEQPDPLTMLFHINPAARWQDGAPGGGRPLTAADVAASLSRTVGLALSSAQPAARRSHDWRSVASVAVTPVRSATVRVALLRPDPHLFNTIAGRFALIQHPAVAESLTRAPLDAAGVAGSGPFALERQVDADLAFRAHTRGHSLPLLDGLVVGPAGDAIERFLAGSAHRVVLEDRRDVAALAAAAPPGAVRERAPFDTPIMSTFHVGAPPWNDARLLEALHLAMDRTELAIRLLGAAGRAVGTTFLLPPGLAPALGLDEPTVRSFEGSASLAGRWQTARERWGAAGGTDLGPVTIDFPSIFDPRYAASAVVPALLNEALGVEQFRPAVESYTTISRKAAEGAYGNGAAAFWFGWGPPFNDPAAARSLYETYHSAGPTARALGFARDDVDRALEELVSAPGLAERGPSAERALSAIAANGFGGVLPWLVEVHDAFRWPYYTPGGPDGWWNQHFDARATIDTADPRYGA